jgi:hypothetical protein
MKTNFIFKGGIKYIIGFREANSVFAQFCIELDFLGLLLERGLGCKRFIALLAVSIRNGHQARLAHNDINSTYGRWACIHSCKNEKYF